MNHRKFQCENDFARLIQSASRLLLGFALLFFVKPVQAQTPLSNLVFTVGTTINASGQDWSYALVGSDDSSILSGKRFAVFAKNGLPGDAGTYSLHTTLAPATDAGTINARLNQSLVLREDLTSLSNSLNVALHKVAGITNQMLAQKVLTALNLANTDADTRGMLQLLARNHPGISLCLGQAFSESITGVTTYEFREADPNTGVAGDVLGRVIITPGSPVILPAPGFPFQVSSNTVLDHLRIRLRWGTPPELRRLALLSYGFNIWRMPKAVAENLGFDVTPPMLSQLYTNATLVNDSPVLAVKDFNTAKGGGFGSGGADDPFDTTTYFFSDDNGHRFGNPAFHDGDQFYYFVTARDLLGRDGQVSPAGAAIACAKILPSAPEHLAVKNALKTLVINGITTNIQQLVLSWAQNSNTNTNYNVVQYWVYRWDNPAMALTNEATPMSNRIAVVSQLAGTNLNHYRDNDLGSPLSPGATNYWYTVRAVGCSMCGPLLSQNSAPIWGVLRDRTAPAAATGDVVGSCGTPVVMLQTYDSITNATVTSGNLRYFRFTCQRRDRGIAWVQFTATGDTASATLGPVYFPPDGDTISVDFSEPATSGAPFVSVACQVGNYYGGSSLNAYSSFSSLVASNVISESIFLAGQLLATALDSSDPLLNALNFNQPFCTIATGVKLYPDGTVRMQFLDTGSQVNPRLIQVLSNANWVDIGTAWPDTNHNFWVSYPACLLGPLPTFRGCVINLPDTGNCGQHVARSSDDGPVAPVNVRFYPTAGASEYRLYRRIDDGPLSLISQGAAAYDTNDVARQMMVMDDSMPPGAVQICYFVQMVDKNGNGSPLANLGCMPVKPPVLPTPVLSEPQSIGNTNNPQVVLNWFCPPAGVHRFQIQIARKDQQPSSGKSTGFAGSLLYKTPNFVGTKYYAGLYNIRSQLATLDEGYYTPPIGANFGPGPQFSITANVLPGVPYEITVFAVDSSDMSHASSKIWPFTWRLTNGVDSVPWPARPLPTVTQFDEPAGTNQRVAAVLMKWTYSGAPQYFLDTRYPVGIRIGAFPNTTLQFGRNVGFTNLFYYQPGSVIERDPAYFLYRRISRSSDRNGEPLLPIVVYRTQVANSVYPKVSGSINQVTPLIEKLPWNYVPGDPSSTVIFDPLIAGGLETVTNAGHGIDNRYLYLRDQHPVMVGAAYQYFVVRMNAKHEVAEIINAGTVTIPPN